MIAILASIVVISVLGAAFVFVFLRLAARTGAEPPDLDWLDGFSMDSYAPMHRLLDAEDMKFLAAQPGYRPEIARRLMAERRRLFVAYLHQMVEDFNQLMAIGKLMLVYSAEDRPEFARTLLRQQARFYMSVCAVRCRLAVQPGWAAIDVRRLVNAVEQIRKQVRSLTPPPAAIDLA